MAGHTHITGGALSITVLLCALAGGCSAQAPTAPERVGAAAIIGPTEMPPSSPAGTSASASVHAKVRTSHNFDLLEGTVRLTLADGSALWGTYHGAAGVPMGKPRASLEGTVTGGTGLFAGAGGSLSGTGVGGFAGDGEFSVALRAAVATGDGESLDFRAALKGTSTSTCTRPHRRGWRWTARATPRAWPAPPATLNTIWAPKSARSSSNSTHASRPALCPRRGDLRFPLLASALHRLSRLVAAYGDRAGLDAAKRPAHGPRRDGPAPDLVAKPQSHIQQRLAADQWHDPSLAAMAP